MACRVTCGFLWACRKRTIVSWMPLPRRWCRRVREADLAAPEPVFRRVAVIGLGLIGGSLASAMRKYRLAGTVVGFDRKAEDAALGVELGVIDEAAESVEQAVRGSDLIVLAVPVRATRAVLEQIQPFLSEDALLTDVGSTKSKIGRASCSGR